MLTTNVSLKLNEVRNAVKIGDSYKIIKITDQCKNWIEEDLATSTIEAGLYKKLVLREIENDIVLDIETNTEKALKNKYSIVCGYVKDYNWNTDLLIAEGSDEPIILRRYNGLYNDNRYIWDIFFLKLEGDVNIQAQITAKKHVYVISKKDEAMINMSALTGMLLTKYKYVKSLSRKFGKYNTEQDIEDFKLNLRRYRVITNSKMELLNCLKGIDKLWMKHDEYILQKKH